MKKALRIFRSQKTQIVRLEGIKSGIYIVNIRLDNGSVVSKKLAVYRLTRFQPEVNSISIFN